MEKKNLGKMEIRELAIADVKDSEFNPRVKLQKGSPEYEKIKASIAEFGFVEPIVVNDVNMTCLGGTQRKQVCQDEGAETIPAVIVHIEDPAKEKKLCIALNRISGDWDMDKLAALLLDDDVTGFFTGFDEGEVDLSAYLPDDGAESSIEDMLGEEEPEEEEAPEPQQYEIVTRVIISNNYKFNVSAVKYYNLIEGFRDNGLFEREDIINELKRRLMTND